jgi:peroxiredoxin
MRLLVLASLLAPAAAATDQTDQTNRTDRTDKAGYTVAPFTLPDSAGKQSSLGDYKGKKAIVVVFLGTQCPINNAYLPRLAELHKTYSVRGVAFLAVNSNRHDTPQRVAEHAREHKIPFPVLKDAGNVVADRFRAERTPEAFLLDASGKVLYRGRIDDQFGYRHRAAEPTRTDLQNALDEVLAGKAVSVPVTQVEGCFIARAVRPRTDGTITYTRHVARILQKNCQECHRPKQIGPMSLLTYEDAVDWSATIREVVAQKRMPPWHADPEHGRFANDRSLSKEERDTLLTWIDNGMAKGDEKDLPPPAEFAEGWRIGKPDVVFEMPIPYTVPSKKDKRSIRYQYFPVKASFTEDRWIQAAEARPGNPKVVHHIIVYIVNPGQKRTREDGIGDGFLVAHAPGDMPAVFPEGTAKKIARGATLLFQVHYTPTATPEKDRSAVGLIFAKKPPKFEARTRSVAQRRLAIPPGEANHKVTSTTTLKKDALLISLMPHMHLRGKSFEYRVVFPDGKTQTLLRVPRYEFNWQTVYRLREPLPLPIGTRIDCTAYFDNSEGNRNNPNPKETVRWGEQTWQEMMIGFIDYVYAVDPPPTPPPPPGNEMRCVRKRLPD